VLNRHNITLVQEFKRDEVTVVRDSKQDWTIVWVAVVFAVAMVGWGLSWGLSKLSTDDCTTVTSRDASGASIARTTCS
jgi:hypothetical protein